jgi:hypothetical protein
MKHRPTRHLPWRMLAWATLLLVAGMQLSALIALSSRARILEVENVELATNCSVQRGQMISKSAREHDSNDLTMHEFCAPLKTARGGGGLCPAGRFARARSLALPS